MSTTLPPSTSATEATPTVTPGLLDEFRRVLGQEGVLVEHGDRLVYECDGYTLDKTLPEVVLLPKTTEQVAAVAKLCREHDVPFLPRGAGTSLSGGTIPLAGGVMLALTRMNQIETVDLANRYAVVQAGVVNLRLTQHLAGTGFHYAPDPSSQGACTIGGNVATNSGGPHTLKYGVTVNHVLGIEAVLPDGEIVRFGGPAEDGPGLDLTGLFCGNEGTFGIITRVWVRLTRDPKTFRTMLAIFDSIDDASKTIGDIIAAGVIPTALEMMDQLITQAVEEAFHFGLPTDAEAVLIIEVDGLEAGLDSTAERILDLVQRNQPREVRAANSAAERAGLWKCRKKAFGAIGRLSPTYCCQDGVVPRSKLPEALRFIQEMARKHDIRIGNVFHAGDGNIHPILMFDERDAAEIDRVLQASHEILDKCIELGGTVTGEHGIGIEKIEFMPKLFNEESLELMGSLRRLFDPEERCNPRKMLPSEGGVAMLPAVRRAT